MIQHGAPAPGVPRPAPRASTQVGAADGPGAAVLAALAAPPWAAFATAVATAPPAAPAPAQRPAGHTGSRRGTPGRHRRATAALTLRAIRDAAVRPARDPAPVPWQRRSALDAPVMVAGPRRHRAPGLGAALGAYRQPAVLAALVAVAVLLVADPPAPLQTRQEAGAEQRAAQQAAERAAERGAGTGRPKDPAGRGPKAGAADGTGRQPAEDARPAPTRPAPGAAAPPSSDAPADPPASATVSPTPDDRDGQRGAGRAALFGPAGSVRFTGTRDVALTFDDGPDPVHTPALLDVLAAVRVQATFCVVGERARAHPDLIRRIAAAGHTLCNHSWDHSLRLGIDEADEIRADLLGTNAAIRAAVPDATIGYFRAPGGNFTPALVATAAALGMRSIYWDVDPRDWDRPAEATDDAHRDRIVAAVERDVREGSIILSHDFDQPETVAAYAALLPRLQQRYTLVALPRPLP